MEQEHRNTGVALLSSNKLIRTRHAPGMHLVRAERTIQIEPFQQIRHWIFEVAGITALPRDRRRYVT